MPVHDWQHVIPDIFHDFHQSWVVRISAALNTGTLPRDCYALLEPAAAGFHRTVLDAADFERIEASVSAPGLPDVGRYARRADRIGIYRSVDDQVIGWIEVLSPGDKHTASACSGLLDRLSDALARGCHLLVIDLHPPGRHDPSGIHAAFWGRHTEHPQPVTPQEPLAVAAYRAGKPPMACVRRVAIGAPLPDAPLYLTADREVSIPLENTYIDAWSHLPEQCRRLIETDA